MPETAATDHELILLIRQDQSYLRRQLEEVLKEMARAMARFETIALNEQKTDIAIATLRQDTSRAMLEASEARSQVGKVQGEIAQWQTRFKTLLWVGGPIAVLVGGLVQEFLKRVVFP
jgi:hypothetical protein